MESGVKAAAAAAPTGVLHLERFLESVLKKNLDTALRQRDDLQTAVAQCAQLRWLLEDMQALSRYHSFVAAATPDNRDVAPNTSSSSPSGRESGVSTSPAVVSKRAQADAYVPLQRNKILVDLGHHFYTQATVKDAQVIYVSIGCGVVLPMSVAEAKPFLDKKESVLREMVLRKSKEVLRIKYRIRVVAEAIARLNERHLGL